MKNKFLSLVLAGFALVSFTAHAQKAGLYKIISDTTATLNASGTNAIVLSGVTNQYGSPINTSLATSSNLVSTVAEYDNVGLTWAFTGVANTTNGTVTLKGSKSFDNAVTFESTPSIIFPITLPTASGGAASYVIATNLDTRGATHILWNYENKASAGGYITNILHEVNLKSPKYGSKQATQ